MREPQRVRLNRPTQLLDDHSRRYCPRRASNAREEGEASSSHEVNGRDELGRSSRVELSVREAATGVLAWLVIQSRVIIIIVEVVLAAFFIRDIDGRGAVSLVRLDAEAVKLVRHLRDYALKVASAGAARRGIRAELIEEGNVV